MSVEKLVKDVEAAMEKGDLDRIREILGDWERYIGEVPEGWRKKAYIEGLERPTVKRARGVMSE